MRLRRFAFFLCLLFSCGFIATGEAVVSITTTAFNPSTATVGMGYSANSAVTATGGQTPYSWSATGFPNGMSINSSSGAPFGTPTVAGTFNVNVTVRDSSNPQQTASKTLTLTVNSASTPALSITSTAFNPSTATVGVGYSANSAVSATGGQTPYSWSATGFPNGMSINSSSGAPFGTPTVAGTFNVNVTVRDSSSPQKTASKTLTLTVNNASTPALSITSNAFNPSTATVGVGYSAQSAVTATGGQTPYSWSATGFPNGMSINSSTGAPFGTPTVAGTFNVNVTVRDSSSPQKTASKTLTLTVSDSGTPALSITTTAFNPSTATVGVGYSAQSAVTATGGQTPYSWSATGFPNGMSINSSTGAPFGTPTVAGTFNVNLTVRDSSSPQKTASKTLTLTVSDSGTPALSITTTAFNPSTATVGVGYSAQSAVTATGGQTPYSWSATGFPNGMSINSSTGAPFGTPTVAGTFNVNVTVQDSSSPQKTASKTLTLTVSDAGTPPLSITSAAFNPSTATVGVGYSAQSAVTATGGQTPYTWSATGFPDGMSINSSNGAPFGTPTVAGTFNVNLTVRDSSDPQKTASKTLPLTVNVVDSAKPVIANVSPNPVIGSTTSQPFTIIGTDFSPTSVVNLRNLTTGTPYPNRNISSQTSSHLVINPNFGTEGHTWSVEVVNGTLSSGPFQFAVVTPTAPPRPDLIPSNVQVSPASVQIGNSITVSATISNQGSADAIASTARVRINTATSGTSSADLAVGDITTPAIAAGSFTVISASFPVPAGAAVGTNYLWVSVDSYRVTNETDGTNNHARSAGIAVNGTTVAKPVIQSLTGDQTIDHDQVAVLTVTATGPGRLTYQWKRNNNPIPGATPSSIRTNQGGSYTVDVSNAGGTITSVAATLTVNPFSNPPPPGTGSLRSPFAFNSFWPTVIITHGWQPTGDYDSDGVSWQTDMALGIKNRFVNHAVNVLLFAWPEAYTLKWSDARTATQSEGHQLAKSLQTFLGPDYQGKIHFIGHSYGSFLNAYAAYNISEHIDQVSILDAPIDVRFASEQAHYANDDVFFRLLLPKDRVDYVDSYIADNATAGLLFGGVIAGSAPTGGLHLDFSHAGIVGYYKDTTISGNSDLFGFNCSVLLGADARDIDRWNPPHLSQQSLGYFADASSTAGDVTRVADNVRGTTQDVLRLNTSGSASTLDSVSANQPVASAGDSAVEFEVSIPSDAQYVHFNFLFSKLGDGDWMTVAFADEVLYSFLGKSFFGSTYDEAVIPVSKFTGQTGVFRVVLHTASSIPAEVSVSNFQFKSGFVGASAMGNISTRLSVGTGDNAMIGGFIITGTQPKTVVVRGIGPSLEGFGIQGALADPVIEVYDGSGVLRGTNDNWNDAETRQQIIDSGLAPASDLEAALWGTINPGAYTVVVRGNNNGTGVGLFEVYDLDRTVDSKLANISTRGFVDTGDNVMIGGTIVVGSTPTRVVVRAIGPSLANFGISNALQDPTLELRDGNGALVEQNDNWRTSHEAEILAANLAPTDQRESAIFQTLSPGAYTAVVRGSGNSTGVALVEAYQLQ